MAGDRNHARVDSKKFPLIMIPYGKQSISSPDIAAVNKVLRSNWITQGPNIQAFENSISAYTGAKFAVAVNNGTTALHLAYLAAGIKRGDEVIMPANTFVATANAALYIGARPVFADIDPIYWNIDPQDIPKRITKRTTAIVVVHFAGHPCDMSAINKIARKHRLIVIEDAAHALGASLGKNFVGNLGSFATTFSFHPVKSITTGEGGMIVTNIKTAAATMRLLRSHGVTKNSAGKNVMTSLGYNYRITDFQAALGSAQMTRLKAFITQRHRAVKWYREEIGDLTAIQLPSQKTGVRSAWHLFVIRVKEPKDRDPLFASLTKAGIGVNYHYPPVYSHPYYQTHGYRRISLPETERYAATCITLPLHTHLTRQQVRYISKIIRRYFHR